MNNDTERLLPCEQCTVPPDCRIFGTLSLLLSQEDLNKLNAQGCNDERSGQTVCIVDRAQTLLATPVDTEVQ